MADRSRHTTGSSAASGWTLLSVFGAPAADGDAATARERRASVSTTSGEFSRVSQPPTSDEESSDDDDYDNVAPAPVDDDSCSDSDLLVVERSELEDVLPDGTAYKLDQTKVARLFDALSVTLARKQAHAPSPPVDARTTADEFCDELPVNFVLRYATRVHNYMHCSNTRLNSTLTCTAVIAVAVVVGLGLGHFIGSTHAWLRRPSMTMHLEKLSTLETELVGRMHHLSDQEDALRTQVHTWRAMYRECEHDAVTCSADEENGTADDGADVELQRRLDVERRLLQRIEELVDTKKQLESSLRKVLIHASNLRSTLDECKTTVGDKPPMLVPLVTPTSASLQPPPIASAALPPPRASRARERADADDQLIDSFSTFVANITTAVQAYATESLLGAQEAGRAFAADNGFTPAPPREDPAEAFERVMRLLRGVTSILDEHALRTPAADATTALTTIWQQTQSLIAQQPHARPAVEHAAPRGCPYMLDFSMSTPALALPSTSNDSGPMEPPTISTPSRRLLDRHDVYEFRRALKKSSLWRRIGDQATVAHLSKLGALTGKHGAPFTAAESHWLDCQTMFWTGVYFADCSNDDLDAWQRHFDVSVFRREHARVDALLNDWTDVRGHLYDYDDDTVDTAACVDRPPAPAVDVDRAPSVDRRPPPPSTAASPRPSWQFARADHRQKTRQNERRADWLFERQRHREQCRKQATTADWLFNRSRGRQNERQKQKYHRDDVVDGLGREWRRHSRAAKQWSRELLWSLDV